MRRTEWMVADEDNMPTLDWITVAPGGRELLSQREKSYEGAKKRLDKWREQETGARKILYVVRVDYTRETR